MKFLYDLFISLYPLGIRLAAPFNPKAKLWLQGRKDTLNTLTRQLDHSKPVVWMHCSSLGEFEQGRTVIEKLKANYSCTVLITFFSPSGYEIRKNYEYADLVTYLPMDNGRNAKQFLDAVKPTLVLFVKYEFWHYYLQEIKNRNIPLLLISAIFRPDQPFFGKGGTFYKNMLRSFTYIFVQNNDSVALLSTIGFTENVSLAGDTRFDRVSYIANNFEPISLIEGFTLGTKVIVAGSTWLEDDKELCHYVNARPDIRFIIAPHDIGKDRLQECLSLYKHAVLYSALDNGLPTGTNTIIIDNVGMLSRLYYYSTIAYVGGGFGSDGVHNVLEPAVYGKPIVFGPEYEKYIEAIDLVENGGAQTIDSALQLEKMLDVLLEQDTLQERMSEAAHTYVANNTGATDKVIEYIYEKRLLTS